MWRVLALILFFGVGHAYRLPFTTPNKYAAFDDASVIDATRSHNVEIVLGKAKVRRRPLFRADRGWEFKLAKGYPSVVLDPSDKKVPFRLWYNAFVSCSWRPLICDPMRDESALLYAESKDGINWTKPNVNLVLLREAHHIGHGNDGGNVLRLGGYGFSVIKDPRESSNSSRLYKAFGMLNQPTYEDVGLVTVATHAIGGTMVSPDGIHWQDEHKVDLDVRWDTHHSLLWDQASGRYVAFTRGPSYELRTLAVSFSSVGKFDGFGKAEVVSVPRNVSDQMQSVQVFPYYGTHLAVLTTYDGNCTARPGRSPVGVSGLRRCNDHARCELAWSPDMHEWHRLKPGASPAQASGSDGAGRLPFARQDSFEIIPLKSGSGYDFGCFPSTPVDVPGEGVRIYFTGVNAPRFRNQESSFMMAQFRPDGLVGVRSKVGAVGYLMTRPLNLSKNTLLVTADIQEGGHIGASILDPDTLIALPGGSAPQVLCSRGGVCQLNGALAMEDNILSAWEGRTARLGFELERATLYTFAFEHRVPEESVIRAVSSLTFPRKLLALLSLCCCCAGCCATRKGRRCRRFFRQRMSHQEETVTGTRIGRSVE